MLNHQVGNQEPTIWELGPSSPILHVQAKDVLVQPPGALPGSKGWVGCTSGNAVLSTGREEDGHEQVEACSVSQWYPGEAPLLSGPSRCHWLPAASGSRQLHQLPHSSSGNSHSLVNQTAQGCQTSSCQQAAALAKQAPLAAAAGSDYHRNGRAARQGEGVLVPAPRSLPPGHCCYPGEQGCSPGGLPSPEHASQAGLEPAAAALCCKPRAALSCPAPV